MPVWAWILISFIVALVALVAYLERRKAAQFAKQEAAALKKSAEHVAGHVVENVGEFIEHKGEKIDAFGHKVIAKGKNLQ